MTTRYPWVPSRTTGTFTSRTSHGVPIPSSAVAGQLLLVTFRSQSNVTMSVTGWTQLVNTRVASVGLSIWYKTAAGGAETCTVTTSGNSVSTYIVHIIADGGTPQASSTATATSTNPNPPSLTPSGGAKDYMWIAVAAESAAATHTEPSTPGTFVRLTPTTSTNLATAEYYAPLTATVNPGVFTRTSSTWLTATVAVPPSALPSEPTNTTRLYLTSEDASSDLTVTSTYTEPVAGSNNSSYPIRRALLLDRGVGSGTTQSVDLSVPGPGPVTHVIGVWVSPPVASTVTLTGLVDAVLCGFLGITSYSVGVDLRAAAATGSISVSSLPRSVTANRETSFINTYYAAGALPSSLTVNAGERIVATLFYTNRSTSATTRDVAPKWAGSAATLDLVGDEGDDDPAETKSSWIDLPEVITFAAAGPEPGRGFFATC